MKSYHFGSKVQYSHTHIAQLDHNEKQLVFHHFLERVSFTDSDTVMFEESARHVVIVALPGLTSVITQMSIKVSANSGFDMPWHIYRL